MCVCKTNARRVLGCTKVPSYTSYLRFLRPPSLPLELDSCMDGITFVDGFSLIILNNSTRVMGRADSSIMNAGEALSCSSMPGGSTRTTWDPLACCGPTPNDNRRPRAAGTDVDSNVSKPSSAIDLLASWYAAPLAAYI